ncbi:MAG: GntR family transcriptional regulator [Acidimicrobiales bacterium]
MKPITGERSLTSQVLEALRAAVIGGELIPGHLYSVRELAEQLSVSRTPVREALMQLATQGMVRFERNRGIRVLQTSVVDLREVFELRLLLEVPATYRAVEHYTPPAVSELRRHLAAMQRAAEAGDEHRMMERDRRFHRHILETAGNRRLANYIDGLRDMVLVRGASTANRSRSLDDIVSEHRKIHEAIEAGDAAGAAMAMRHHILHTAELLIAQEADAVGPVDVSDLRWIEFTPPLNR